jgi:hypothetical protein
MPEILAGGACHPLSYPLKYFQKFSAPFSSGPLAFFAHVSSTNLTCILGRPVSSVRVPYGLLYKVSLQFLRKMLTYCVVTSLLFNSDKGFTGPKLKIYNVYRPPYGFTGPEG